MTREEAIEVVKERLDYYEREKRLKAACEVLIPELAESEDERIRRTLVEYFGPEVQLDFVRGVPIKKIRDWLEKQKENPKSTDSISSDCMSDVKCEDRWHKVGDSLPDNGRLVLAKDCLGNVLLARYDGENWEVNVYDNEDHYCHNSISKWCEIPSERQKEQKHILKFKVGDKVHLEGDDVNILTITGIEKDRYLTDNSYGPILFGAEDIWERIEQKPWKVGANAYFTPEQKPVDLSDMMVHKEPYIAPVPTPMVADEQKPAEWNEEDKSFYDSIVCEVIKEGMHPTPEQAKWFKSLPERFNLQPKTEWSEEDEKMLKSIDLSLDCYSEGQAPALVMQISRERDWLKSLRPQYHGDVTMAEAYKMGLEAGKASSWKPSEEQMKALLNAEGFLRAGLQHDSAKTIAELYEHLKQYQHE